MSFVEAAIFLVSAGVLVLVLARAEGGKFHLPGGDGTVIFAAGLWASALIFYRVFDRPDVSGEGGTVGIQWGFFVAFVCAGALAVAGPAHARRRPRREPAGARAAPSRVPPPSPPAPREGARDVDDDAGSGRPWQRRSRSGEPDPAEAGTQVVPASEARTEVGPGRSRGRRGIVPCGARTRRS